MKRTSLNRVGITLIAGLGLLIVSGCTAKQDNPGSQTQVKTVNVTTQRVEPTTFTSYARMIGTVKSANDVRLSAEVGGRVLRYYVEKGERVRKGEVIAKINDERLEKEEARLEALVKQARERYLRQKRLWKQDSIGSEIDYLNAKYQYQQQKAALEQVRVKLADTKVKAPFRAVVDRKMVEEGEMVAAGTPMVRLIASDRLKISAGVPARYSNMVMPGDTANVWFDVIGSDTLSGPIHYVSNSINPQARTFTIELMIPNAKHRYKVGMLANVRLRLRHMTNEVVVGVEYVYRTENGYVVYTVDKNGEGKMIARERSVQLGPTYNSRVILKKGIKPGEELITVGSAFLEDSMRINIVNDVRQNPLAMKNEQRNE